MRPISLAALAYGFAVCLSAAPAQAMTFAEYGAASSAPNLDWTISSSLTSGSLSTTGVGASADTFFSFLTPTLSSLANLPALFTLSATAPASDPAVAGLGQTAEQNLTGSFSFTYTGSTPLVVGSHTYTTGANLLSGTFNGAEIIGPSNGSTGSVQDAILSGGSVSFTSDIAKFSPTGDKGLSLALTSVLPFFGANPGNALSSFSAVSNGSFESDLSGGGGGIPEPATWAVMLLGFGAIGAAARNARRKAAKSFV
jgi:hypothetical protein